MQFSLTQFQNHPVILKTTKRTSLYPTIYQLSFWELWVPLREPLDHLHDNLMIKFLPFGLIFNFRACFHLLTQTFLDFNHNLGHPRFTQGLIRSVLNILCSLHYSLPYYLAFLIQNFKVEYQTFLPRPTTLYFYWGHRILVSISFHFLHISSIFYSID